MESKIEYGNIEHRQQTRHQIIINIPQDALITIDRGEQVDITLHSEYTNKEVSVGLTQGQIDKLTIRTNNMTPNTNPFGEFGDIRP
jgi:hypothetical protein